MTSRFLVFFLLGFVSLAADPPQAEISNGLVRAKLYLPDAQDGYYRATRFDWSGVISSLEYKGHNYFGKWFERYDPKIHDAIMGPVEEFLTNGAGLGYTEAKAGESFVRIGVGAARKPEEPRYRQFVTYEITDNGKWTVRKGADWVEFTHELQDTSGYAYIYRKTVRLTEGKPEMVLEHSLKNTGRKTIETSVYNHNFYVIDGQPTGPDVVVKFPFEVRAPANFRSLAETRGKEARIPPGTAAGPDRAERSRGLGRIRQGLRHPRGKPQDRSRCAANRRPGYVEVALLVDSQHSVSRGLRRCEN